MSSPRHTAHSSPPALLSSYSYAGRAAIGEAPRPLQWHHAVALAVRDATVRAPSPVPAAALAPGVFPLTGRWGTASVDVKENRDEDRDTDLGPTAHRWHTASSRRKCRVGLTRCTRSWVLTKSALLAPNKNIVHGGWKGMIENTIRLFINCERKTTSAGRNNTVYHRTNERGINEW